MNQDQVLDLAIKAGSILLKNGAEIYRVEETINRICQSYGVSCHAFVLPTGVFVSSESGTGFSTIIRRIPSRTVDLTKISVLNDLSRRIEKQRPEYAEVIKELDRISNAPTYSKLTIILCYAMTAFVYALLFGGSTYDAGCAFMLGGILGLLRIFLNMSSSFPFIEYFLGGLTAGFLSSFAAFLIPFTNTYVVIIGVVTNMLPGVALTNGLRDLLHGDSVSGLTKIGEALLTVFVIAAGTGIGLTIWLWRNI